MMKMTSRSMLVLCSFLVLVGCGDDGVVLTGTLLEFPSGTVVAGANVCMGDSDECVVTDAAGVYTFESFPSGSEQFLTMTATGYLPALLAIQIPAENTNIDSLLLPDGVIGAFEVNIMDEFDPATGYMAAGAFTTMGGVEGATYTASPAGLGPIYLGPMGLPDPMLTEQTVAGRAGWIDLPPGGEGEVTLVPPAGTTCTLSSLDWQGSGALSQRFPIRAGHISGTFNYDCM